MKLKRKVSLFAIISIIFSVFMLQNVRAEGGSASVTLTGQETVKVGEEVEVSLQTKGFSDYAYNNYEIYISYPSDALELIKYYNDSTEIDDLVAKIEIPRVLGFPEMSDIQGKISMAGSGIKSKNLNTGDAAAAKIKFKVKENAEENLEIKFLEDTSLKKDSDSVPLIFENYSFSVVTQEYEVKFVDWNGDIIETVSVSSGERATAPDAPTRAGYTFASWDSAFDNVTADMTVTATYEANENTLTFDPNGGTGEMEAKKINTDATVTLQDNSFVREGYSFKGWSETATGEVQYQNGSEYKMGTADATLYAVWEINTYPLTVEVEGNGTVEPSATTNVNHGGSKEFTIKPEANHYLGSIKLDGEDVTSKAKLQEDGSYKYAIENIVSERTLKVVLIGAAFDQQDEQTKVWLKAGEGVFPRGAELVVEDSNDSQSLEAVYASVDEQIKSTIERITAYDISVKDENNEKVQPQTKFGKVTVRIPVPETFDFTEEDLKAYRVNEGSADDIKYEGRLVELDGQRYYEFEVDHFSDYVVVDKKLDKVPVDDDNTPEDPETPTKPNPDTKPNTDAKPNPDTKPNTDAKPNPDAKPNTDAKPSTDTKLNTDAKPSTDTKLNTNTKSNLSTSSSNVDGEFEKTGESSFANILFGLMMLSALVPFIFKKRRSTVNR